MKYMFVEGECIDCVYWILLERHEILVPFSNVASMWLHPAVIFLPSCSRYFRADVWKARPWGSVIDGRQWQRMLEVIPMVIPCGCFC